MELISLDEALKKIEALKVSAKAAELKILDQLSKEDRGKIGSPIKILDLSMDTFNANGRKYVIRTSLTLNRFIEFERLQSNIGFDATYPEIFGNIRKAYDLLNDSQPLDCGRILYGIMHGLKDVSNNDVLAMCSLFICLENEDLTVYDPVLTKEKIADWAAEGIAMESFFAFASALVNGYSLSLEAASANTSIPKNLKSGGEKEPKGKVIIS